jgi:hypothetical protein
MESFFLSHVLFLLTKLKTFVLKDWNLGFPICSQGTQHGRVPIAHTLDKDLLNWLFSVCFLWLFFALVQLTPVLDIG